jgi:hypothetical protein
MEQFRQRVAATCHIGPLDEDETRAYIEHRLKCAGANGKPSFDDAAFGAIHKASGGIPRRINTLCDRLLLLGFMAERTHLALSDVEEVLNDIAQESKVPKGPITAVDIDTGAGELTEVGEGGEVRKLRINGHAAHELGSEITALGERQYADRLARLEGSLARLERINLQTLDLLQRLVTAAAKTD